MAFISALIDCINQDVIVVGYMLIGRSSARDLPMAVFQSAGRKPTRAVPDTMPEHSRFLSVRALSKLLVEWLTPEGYVIVRYP